MSEVKTIRLYGQLGARYGRVHRFAVSSTAEAVQALCSQVPGVERYLTEAKDNGLTFAVFNGKRNLKEENLHDPVGGEDIRIAPVPIGSKRQGLLQTIVGIVLIVVGILTWYSGGVSLVVSGVGMVAGGIIQMLTPLPKLSTLDSADANASYVFNGPINTQAQGNPVPICYGRLIVGSSVISAGIIANQEQIAGTNAGDGSSHGGGFWTDRFEYLQER